MGDIENESGWRPWRLGRRDKSRAGSDGALAPFGVVYVALLGLGTLGALLVYLGLVAFVPGAAGTRLDAMKTALLVVAGSGAGAGLYVQYRKQQTDEAKSALDHANSRRDQDKLFTERYTQAAAQLGSAAAAVRLAGVYALARIADDSARDRPTCLSVLCAYLRMPYDPAEGDPAEREVRSTAQTVVAQRLHVTHPGFWQDADVDLHNAYLEDIDLARTVMRSINTMRTRFAGLASFHGFEITDEARFDAAQFSRGAGFTTARFGGDTSFVDAQFDRITRFEEARFDRVVDFRCAKFDYILFDQATFADAAGFGEVNFEKDASFRRAEFRQEADFLSARFAAHAEFSGARMNIDEVRWPDGFTPSPQIVWMHQGQPVDLGSQQDEAFADMIRRAARGANAPTNGSSEQP